LQKILDNMEKVWKESFPWFFLLTLTLK
jgi:hypothetical protein